MLSNITVLPDESLGGIKREYREVKRKAVTGERIKITAGPEAFFGQDFRRTIHEVTDVVGFNVKTTGKWKDGSVLNPAHDDYVVLEPTAAVYVDDPDGVGRKYRMVDRKAAVGERVIIVNEGRESCGGAYYRKGNVGYFVDYGQLYGNIRVSFGGTSRKCYVSPGDYRVLEPLTVAPLLSEQSAQDQAAATISALALRLDALTERMDALEAKVDAAYTTQPTTAVDTEVVLKAVRKFSEGLKRSVSDALKTPQQRRDEIVELAKADVKRLENKHQSRMEFEGAASFWPRGCEKNGKTPCHFVEYVVDRGKRTVVALIRFIKSRRVDYRGVAKCAPGDVFNAHIGKAISLRRALGLDVPAEYLNVPKPTEVRVGDYVRDSSGLFGGAVGYVDEIEHRDGEIYGVLYRNRRSTRGDGRIWTRPHYVTALDDTREEVAA
ncbi:hypothetical protein J2W97_000838 [Paenibacillus jamilae]|jgi:hypothetical protein|uniref:hypothetical protein n=1 Tax=Paenibacillus polymyxa TaxID=1406 RepID=UPI00158128B5|nr:hypothetical protein [Paenibacillus polymyxa]MDP9674855.1 hypothetical protein [Paenibacillus jamilae]MBY0023779.1 hypothetical protein [Paenibacillus polymyxa]MBY0056451.1 hypothetical protein [Paenibacillus polymyxa]MBY0071798.1 hypothetical protein [Paenibacillus polymyxa]MBY0080636.1 hypothetical protein [Paenibacillus polymyxa]